MHTLFTIPAAGVSAKTYQAWKDMLPKEINLYPVELAGRGKRSNEPLLSSIQEVAVDLVDASNIKEIPPFSYSILGHSVGALIAYEMVRVIQQKDMTLPYALFVIGKNPPNLKDLVKTHEMENELFIKHLKVYGGIPPFFMQNKKYLNMFIPRIRADIKLAEQYNHNSMENINVPIIAICGREEELSKTIKGWGNFTNRGCNLHVISGGHFEMFINPQQIVNIISKEIDSAYPVKCN